MGAISLHWLNHWRDKTVLRGSFRKCSWVSLDGDGALFFLTTCSEAAFIIQLQVAVLASFKVCQNLAFLLWHGGNESHSETSGSRFNPWPCSVGYGSSVAMNCGVGYRCGYRHGSDLVLLWLWRRLAAVALIRPLAWEPLYAAGMALKSKKQTNKQNPPKTNKQKSFPQINRTRNLACFLSLLIFPSNQSTVNQSRVTWSLVKPPASQLTLSGMGSV